MAANDNKDFNLLCSEIVKQDELESLQKKDERIYSLLNDYFSRRIYSRFAFLAQNNDKKGAGACLADLIRFKSVSDLACKVFSYKMPSDAAFYLCGDFKVKIDYLDKLAAEGSISTGEGLDEFESVIKALISLYDEKAKHEAAAGEGESGDDDDDKPRKTAAAKGRKKKPDKKTAAAEKKRGPNRGNKKIAGVDSSTIEMLFCLFFAAIFFVTGMIAFGTPNEASTGGAILGGAFGAVLGSLLVNIIFLHIEYIIRDAVICLVIAVITLSLLR